MIERIVGFPTGTYIYIVLLIISILSFPLVNVASESNYVKLNKIRRDRGVVGSVCGHFYRNIVVTRLLKCDDTGDFRRKRLSPAPWLPRAAVRIVSPTS